MISIIIPTYNRPKQLLDCLRSLHAQQYIIPFEVIVIARDPAPEIFKICYDFYFVKLIEYNSPGNGPAKNHAVMFAKGDFIAFIDDDCLVDEHWLRRLVLAQEKTGADIVVGQCLPADFTNPYLVAHQGMIMYYLDKNPTTYLTGEPIKFTDTFNKVEVGTSMNMLIRKSTFECLKGFSVDFANHYGDDYDFNVRWKLDSSIKAAYYKTAMVKHNHHLTFKKLIKLSFRYGMGLEVCRKAAMGYLYILATKSVVDNNFKIIHAHYDYKVHPSLLEYGRIKYYISWQSPLLDNCSSFVRRYASWLAILAMLVKRLGSWYGKHYPEVSSKVYDGV